MGEKRVVRKHREPNAAYDVLIDDDQVQDIFVDGYVGQALGVPFIQTNLYREMDEITKEGETIGQRLIKYRLIMPTSAFIEMCAKTLASVAESEEKFDISLKNYVNVIKSYLPRVIEKKSDEKKTD